MGTFFTKPEDLQTQDSILREADRLLHSYSYLVKGIHEKGSVNKIDEMKQNLIHQQWYMVFPYLEVSKKETYKKTFENYVSQFSSWKQFGLSPIDELEEKLIH